MSTFRFKQFEVCQDHAAMKVGTDGCLLGALAKGGMRILDIGTGTGLLALMMAQRFGEASVTAVEVDADAAADARANFENSLWSGRISLHEEAFQKFCVTRQAEKRFDSIVCNPPYFNDGVECEDAGRQRARHTSSLSYGELVSGVASLLSDDGVFSVVLPSDAYGQFVGECLMNSLWLSRRYNIHTVAHKPAKRVVLMCSHQQVDNPLVEECCLHNADGTYSEWYGRLLADFLLYVPKPKSVIRS